LVNIRWYEYTFLILGILAALVTDGLTIARLVKIGSLNEPDFAYGILILVHSGIYEIFRKKSLYSYLLFSSFSSSISNNWYILSTYY
jgi:hypothetical protein